MPPIGGRAHLRATPALPLVAVAVVVVAIIAVMATIVEEVPLATIATVAAAATVVVGLVTGAEEEGVAVPTSVVPHHLHAATYRMPLASVIVPVRM